MSKNQEINKLKSSGDYLEEFIFPSLRKALEKKCCVMENENPEEPNPRRLIKGLDLLAQELWNSVDVMNEEHLFMKSRVKEILNET